MVVRLSLFILLIGFTAGFDNNIKWDIAIAVGNQIELLSKNGTLLGITTQEFKNLKALTYDGVRHQFIVSDMDDDNDTIYRIDLTKTGDPIPIITNLQDDVKHIAIDSTTDRIYWTDGYQKRIQWKSLSDDSEEKVLFEFDNANPKGITIDFATRKLYWTNAKYPLSTIERSNLDGTDHETLISDGIALPSGITIDQFTNKIYWGDNSGMYSKIESADMNGNNRKIVHQDRHQKIYGIVVSNDMIYWTDENNNALWSVKKNDDSPAVMLRKFSEPPMGIFLRIDNVLMTEKKDEKIEELFIPAVDSIKCLNFGELTPHGCKCNRGFTGTRCEFNLCYNFCVIGDCYFSSKGYPQCRCPLGFNGPRCEHEICKDFCLNDGVCQLNNKTQSATCTCKNNFSGVRCERTDDMETLCNLMCNDAKLQITNEDDGIKCSCGNKIDSYSIVSKKNNTIVEPSYLSSNMESQFIERFKDPIVISSWLLTGLMFMTIVGLVVILCRLKLKRPRIKKRIIVNKNITPLTYRPGQSTEQCEITIENCCNMNICETPCFEPPRLGYPQHKKNEEKKNLITSMENGEDIY